MFEAYTYDPEQYPELLCKYMKEAYTYLERNDQLHYYAAVTDITMGKVKLS